MKCPYCNFWEPTWNMPVQEVHEHIIECSKIYLDSKIKKLEYSLSEQHAEREKVIHNYYNSINFKGEVLPR
jgi:hypothetical protein